MASTLKPLKYRSTLAQSIADPGTRAAFQDLSEKLEQLARDAEKRVSGMDAVAAGTVVLWFGTRATIPAGWSEATFLQGKFVRGTPSAGTPGATGGSDTHTHGTGGTATGGGSTLPQGSNNTGHNITGPGGTLVFSDWPHNHNIPNATTLPPYMDGIYIMKD